jgi:hypothetical protein
MKLAIKVSTVFIFILTQVVLSILFYLDDSFISGIEAIVILIISIPVTFFIEWMWGDDDQDKS